ncbi:hypothetical protein BDZ97DRAFT_1201662 [Flammula alnicola]|nr:hypothetical protein BDZ97DRAFT_1201662 [Flammula alnicola]
MCIVNEASPALHHHHRRPHSQPRHVLRRRSCFRPPHVKPNLGFGRALREWDAVSHTRPGWFKSSIPAGPYCIFSSTSGVWIGGERYTRGMGFDPVVPSHPLSLPRPSPPSLQSREVDDALDEVIITSLFGTLDLSWRISRFSFTHFFRNLFDIRLIFTYFHSFYLSVLSPSFFLSSSLATMQRAAIWSQALECWDKRQPRSRRTQSRSSSRGCLISFADRNMCEWERRRWA